MRFVLFIGIVQSVLFLGHWFFYRTLVRFFGVTDSTKLLVLKVVLGLLSVSLVLTSFLAFRYSNFLMRCLYTAAASWLGILYLFILGSILCWIFYGSARLLHLPLDRRILLEIFLGIALLASFCGFINAGMIRITRMGVQLPLLPGPWKGKTAVWISDTHLGQVRGHEFSRRIAAKVKDLH